MTLKLFKNRSEEIKLLEKCIRQKAVEGSTLRILEAGCGRSWIMNLDGISYTLTGVDINEIALEKRRNQWNDLDKVIVGDLSNIDLPENQYDVIYNSFVLEHLYNPEVVLDNFMKWLKPNGLLILRLPDRNSVYGFVARFSPFWIHVLFRKYILRQKNAGKPGFGPYRTFYHDLVSSVGIRQYCQKAPLKINQEYGQAYDINRKGAIFAFIRVMARVFSYITLGRLACEHWGLTYVLIKDQPQEYADKNREIVELDTLH